MSTVNIHPTAVVSENAVLGRNVVVEPYAIINDRVEIGDDCVIGPHAVIRDYVRMGSNNRLDPHVILGGLPQDVSFDIASETWVEIGDSNIIRECSTIHRSTRTDRPTRVGSNNYIMGYVHIGHDCSVGSHVIMANYVGLGGHVELADRIVMGAAAVVHQFCRIGSYVMVGGFTPIRKDVLPYTMIAGDPANHYRLNTVGLRRNGIKGDAYKALEKAYRAIKAGDKSLEGIESTEQIEHLKAWLSVESRRGLSAFI
jgi:UDP-N-acetylglucosamine acyltransferase